MPARRRPILGDDASSHASSSTEEDDSSSSSSSDATYRGSAAAASDDGAAAADDVGSPAALLLFPMRDSAARAMQKLDAKAKAKSDRGGRGGVKRAAASSASPLPPQAAAAAVTPAAKRHKAAAEAAEEKQRRRLTDAERFALLAGPEGSARRAACEAAAEAWREAAAAEAEEWRAERGRRRLALLESGGMVDKAWTIPVSGRPLPGVLGAGDGGDEEDDGQLSRQETTLEKSKRVWDAEKAADKALRDELDAHGKSAAAFRPRQGLMDAAAAARAAGAGGGGGGGTASSSAPRE